MLTRVLKRDGSYGHLRWKVRVYAKQSRSWRPEEIGIALEELLRADRLIKSGGLSDRAALEEALWRMGSRDALGGRGSGGESLVAGARG